MEITVINRQATLSIPAAKIKKIVKAVIALEDAVCDEVTIHLVDRMEISSLHAQFFQDPSPTDCISFPVDEEHEAGYRVLGDVFVCPDVACEFSIKKKLNPLDETILYIVHGLLHLLGYDDLSPVPRRKMREAEKKHMENLRMLGLLF